MSYSDHDKNKDYQNAWAAQKSNDGRNIGEPPKVVDQTRRDNCEHSFLDFLTTYHSHKFTLSFSDLHYKIIDSIQDIILEGGQSAISAPRGSGKTTLIELGAEWGVLFGHRKFIFIISSDADASKDILENIKADLEFNDLLYQDFPEVCFPIRSLDGINKRQGGQHINGERTNQTWGSDEIILPTVQGSKCSGSVIRTAGITGRIRGAKATTPTGSIRPDCLLIDDFQTYGSASSPKQIGDRLSIIEADALKMAGPAEKIAAFATCTVIKKQDAADQLLDRTKYPDWQGIRSKMLIKFPTDMKLWEKYNELRVAGLQEGEGAGRANDFYLNNQEALDAGAVHYWPDRFNEDEHSAIQNAMNEYFKNEQAFYSEFQNDPTEISQIDFDIITHKELTDKQNGVKKGIIPSGSTKLVAAIDVQKKVLFYTVIAFDNDYGANVIDYGTCPDQGKLEFTLNQISNTLQDLGPTTLQGQIVEGLTQLTTNLFKKKYQSQDGTEFQIERIIVDAGYETDSVKKFVLGSEHSSKLRISFGRAFGPDRKQLDQYKHSRGDTWGWGWYSPAGNNPKHILYDANAYKTFLHQRMGLHTNDRGAFNLYTDKPYRHKQFCSHLLAEHPTPVTGNGITVNLWKCVVSKENHWLDTVIMCYVAANEQGIFADFMEEKKRNIPKNNRRKKVEVNW